MGGIYTIIGKDDLLVSQAAKKAMGDLPGDALEVIDSATATNEELQLRDLRAARESAFTPPFLSPSKATWWKNVKFLPGGDQKSEEGDGEGKVSEAVKEALLDFARELASSRLPDNQTLVISGPSLRTASHVAKALSAAGEMICFQKQKGAAAARDGAGRAIERAAELALEFEPGAAERFVERVGDDTRSLYSELDKLKCYLPEGETKISQADIDDISSPGAGVEPVLWTVTDAICARDADSAVAGVRAFEGTNGYEIMMTIVIEKQFRQLVEFKSADEAGKLAAAIKGMNPWTARKISDAVRNWSLNELRTARMRFMNLRERLVSTSGSGEDAIAIELVRAIGPRRKRGVR